MVIGLALTLGATSLTPVFEQLSRGPGLSWAALVLGVGLFALSFRMDSKKALRAAKERAESGGGRLVRWRRRLMEGDADGGSSVRALIAVASAAVIAELATMLPYLTAIGIIESRAPSWATRITLLSGYCIVMILPALVLLVARVVAAERLRAPLAAIEGWLTRYAQSASAWIVGIVGFMLATHAISALGLIGHGSGHR